MSLFKIMDEVCPSFLRDVFLNAAHRREKLQWIATAFSRHSAIPHDLALFVATNELPGRDPEIFETVEGLEQIAALVAEKLAVGVPPLRGWQTIH